MDPDYRRVMIKLSGEAFMGRRDFGIDPQTVRRIADQLVEVNSLGVQISVVVGAGNFFRGVAASEAGIDRATGDYMGMLATVMNALALQDALEKKDAVTRLQTAIQMQQIAEPYIRRKAIRHLEKGRIVIFAAGTGSPYFTTDTAAALRALEIGAEAIFKATKVDGIYDCDPEENPHAVKMTRVTYIDYLQKRLRVMDSTAISLCMENSIPIIVFNLNVDGNIRKAICGEEIGTTIS